MMRTKKGATGLALGAVVALAAAACSSSGGGGGSATSSAAVPQQKGGTLTILNLGPHNGLDPQQSYVGADMSFGARAYARSLVTYSVGADSKLVPDLATDTGQMSDGGKTWKFTLVDTGKWQDGQKVTCEDVKYGISRTFATDVISNGPTYILTFLDIPKDADGTSAYKGPYKATGNDLYDKAVTCEGNTLTLHFATPWADFNYAAASLMAYSPVRKDKDKGDKSLFEVFSNGPYMQEGTFDPNKGGTWVRNPNWDESTDKVRKAYPDKIIDVEGIQSEQTYQRLLADGGEDKTAITWTTAPPSVLPQIASNPNAANRTINSDAPYVDYVQPNVTSEVMKDPKVRQAFAMATNRDAYVTANGGKQVMTPSYMICNPVLKCYNKDFNPFGAPTAGDPVAAKKVLQDAGKTLPLNITVVYRKTATRDASFAALKQTWDQAGFNVTLEGITDRYYRTIAGVAMKNRDAFYASWGADWPSGSTDIPPLFDGRINITEASSNQDYGWYNNPAVNTAIDAAYLIPDTDAREKAWGDIDQMISKDGGVIPLVSQKFTFVQGSQVKGAAVNNQFGGYIDIATVSVK
jgi:peptide/nickel transport system substrate-binding protein